MFVCLFVCLSLCLLKSQVFVAYLNALKYLMLPLLPSPHPGLEMNFPIIMILFMRIFGSICWRLEENEYTVELR